VDDFAAFYPSDSEFAIGIGRNGIAAEIGTKPINVLDAADRSVVEKCVAGTLVAPASSTQEP